MIVESKFKKELVKQPNLIILIKDNLQIMKHSRFKEVGKEYFVN